MFAGRSAASALEPLRAHAGFDTVLAPFPGSEDGDTALDFLAVARVLSLLAAPAASFAFFPATPALFAFFAATAALVALGSTPAGFFNSYENVLVAFFSPHEQDSVNV